jgi:hypothetical protein
LERPDLLRARYILNRAEVRKIVVDGVVTIGVWSDLDGPEIRAALRTLGNDRIPVRYLDGSGIPPRYKLRRVEGEPVPISVLVEMERQPAAPWQVQDQMLKEMGWCSKGIPWVEWRAEALNKLFRELSVTGQQGRITAAVQRKKEGRPEP